MRLLCAASLCFLLALLPTTATAQYGETTWGMSLAEVRALHPEGRLVHVSEEGLLFRVAANAFGYPTRRTYAFSRTAGLRAIYDEFPQPGLRSGIEAKEYQRRTSAEALEIRRLVSQKLTEVFGAPAHESGTPSNGATIWRAPDASFRLRSVPVHDGRVHLALRIARPDDKGPRPVDEELVEEGTWRTPSSSWSKEFVHGVRWGMGPGDVRAKYPQLEPSLSFATQRYGAEKITERDDATFEFFEGRLVAIELTRHGALSLESTDEERRRNEADNWRTRKALGFRMSYGEPILQPSPEKGLVWMWRDETTLVTIDQRMRPHPTVRIEEIASYERLRKAKRAYEAFEEARSDAALPKTAPESWSSAGWQEARWGMGPRDVKHALGLPGLIRRSTEGTRSTYLGFLPQVILEMPLRAHFTFESDRLIDVQLEPNPIDRDESREPCKAWVRDLRKLLTEKYGPASCDPHGDCIWGNAGTYVTLREAAAPCDSSLGYIDRALVDRKQAEDRAAKKRELEKL